MIKMHPNKDKQPENGKQQRVKRNGLRIERLCLQLNKVQLCGSCPDAPLGLTKLTSVESQSISLFNCLLNINMSPDGFQTVNPTETDAFSLYSLPLHYSPAERHYRSAVMASPFSVVSHCQQQTLCVFFIHQLHLSGL